MINTSWQDLPWLTSEALAALQARNDPPFIFRRAKNLVRLEEDGNGECTSRDLTVDRTRHAIARAANWVKEVRTRLKPAIPPLDVVRDILATPDLPFPVLQRITNVPCFAPDGTLIVRPGYHEDAGIFYAPPKGLRIPKVKDRPTDTDVKKANRLIGFELLGDFPFVGDADRAHAYALTIEHFARELIDGSTPLYDVEAPTPGSGKGLCIAVTLLPAFGRHLRFIAEARDDDEWRKRLISALRECRGTFIIDNARRPLDSGVIAAALTAPVLEERLLGTNEMVGFPIRWVWAVTGNNPLLSMEIARRAVRIRLDSSVEKPWLRDPAVFRHQNLVQWAEKRRGRLIWAALTLIRAWLAAGRPKPAIRPLGSFEAWSTVMGGILEVAGIPGFLGNALEFYEVADQEGAAWNAFVRIWHYNFATAAVGVGDLFPFARAADNFDLAGESEHAQRVALGKKLSEARDRVIGDYRIAAAGTVQNAARWQLLPVATAGK
jgi:putative DNA primase/helicase